jgi:hypothetical protein
MTAEKYNGMLYNIEKLITEIPKFEMTTLAGVLCMSSFKGMIGSFDHHVSTATKLSNPIALASRKPQTKGDEKGISSAVFNETPSKRPPTAMTNVREPR